MGERRGRGTRGEEGGGKGKGIPGLGDDDVVKGSVAFAEAGEADFEDHCFVVVMATFEPGSGVLQMGNGGVRVGM